MRIDITHFPLVWVSPSTQGDEDWEPKMNTLLDRQQRFVLLGRQALGADPSSVQAEKKRWARWFKRNRARLRQWCAGSIVVVPAQSSTLALKALLQPLAKAFGFPVRIAEEAQAHSEATRLLSDYG
jgi:NAD-dependent oxidoreductase involved in siderophore biosynthesis